MSFENHMAASGRFDIIGDIHGCVQELNLLLEKLGYEPFVGSRQEPVGPAGRQAIFVGDLVDRGPDTPGVLRTVMKLVESGLAMCVAGNHDVLLRRKLQSLDVSRPEMLKESLQQIEAEPA